MQDATCVAAMLSTDLPRQITGWTSTFAPVLATAVIGSIVAGVTAWLKTWLVSRDDRSRASGQLELATQRTEFARSWLEAYQVLESDSTSPEQVRLDAKHELDAAYRDAQRGFKEGRSAFGEASYEQLVAQVRGFLLLQPGMRRRSQVIVVLGYACVLTLAGILGIQKDVLCEVPDAAAASEESELALDAASAQTMDIVTTTEGGTINGTVYEMKTTDASDDQGSVIEGITVTLTRLEDDEDALEDGVTRTLQATTDEDGQYKFEMIDLKLKYSVTAASASFQSRSVQVPPEDVDVVNGLDLTLERKPAPPTCKEWWVGSGWVWLFAVIVGTAILRVLFGYLVNRSESPESSNRSRP